MGTSLAMAAVFGAHRRHFGGGLILIGLIVIALVVVAGVQWNKAHQARQTHDDEWRRQPPPPPPASAPPGATPPAADGDGTAAAMVAPPAPPPPATAGPADRGAAPPPPSVASLEADLPPSRIFHNSNGDWAVETRQLTKRFGNNTAVNGVDLYVPRGCAFGYLGPNGAGKTTLIRTLLGLTHADEGSMALLGVPVPKERSRALARVGAIVDEPRFHAHLTGRENLQILAAARGGEAGGRIAPALDRVGLTERANDRVGSYSMGMRQRLGVASCLLGDPELLILDEPMNGLDPAGMHEMRSMIQSLVAEGRTVMLSSHLLDEVERTCDAVAIVDRGRVIRQGPIDELVRGAGTRALRIECSDAPGAARLVDEARLAAGTSLDATGLSITLPAGSSREAVAAIVQRLVAGGVSIYGVQESRTRLEDWFLSVTSRLGEPS